MQQLFKGKVVAFHPFIENSKLLGYAVVSKDNSILFSTELNPIKLLKTCKRVLFFNFALIKEFVEEFDFKDDLMGLYYQLNPEFRFNKNLQTIIKNEYFVDNDSNTTYLVKHAQAKRCIVEAKFILKYFVQHYKEANKEILKLDNSLIKQFHSKSLIRVDQIKLRTELSLINKLQWNTERDLWKQAGGPFLSISQLDKSLRDNTELIEGLAKRNKYKTKYQVLSKYLNYEELEVDFDFTGSATGRIICRDDIGLFAPDNEFKHLFYPQEGHKFISCDYSKQEAAILAFVSGDKQLQKDLRKEEFYALLAKKYLDEKDKAIGKNLFYGLIYGSTSKNLAHKLQADYRDIEDALEGINSRYSEMSSWLKQAKKLKTNYYNRPLHNNTANAYIQSTAADLVKRKLLETKEFNPVLVFSDNIVYSVAENNIVQASKNIKEILQNHEGFELSVKLSVSDNLKII